MADRKYIGHAKLKQTQYGDIMKISIHSDGMAILKQAEASGHGWVNIECLKRREPKGDITHSVCLDEWKPNKQGGQSGGRDMPPAQGFDDDIPF